MSSAGALWAQSGSTDFRGMAVHYFSQNDYEKAAKKNEVLDNIGLWWNSNNLQNVLKKFRNRYAKKEEKQINKLVNFLKKKIILYYLQVKCIY